MRHMVQPVRSCSEWVKNKRKSVHEGHAHRQAEKSTLRTQIKASCISLQRNTDPSLVESLLLLALLRVIVRLILAGLVGLD